MLKISYALTLVKLPRFEFNLKYLNIFAILLD
jgi:hypothetical protein